MSYELYGDSKEKSYFLDVKEKEQTRTGGFYTHYFEVSISALILLQKKQRELDELFNNGTDIVRRYAVKEYKIWVMGTDDCAYYYHKYGEYEETLILAQSDINLLKSYNLFPRYYLKLDSYASGNLKNFLIFDQQTFDAIRCKEDYHILKSSILY